MSAAVHHNFAEEKFPFKIGVFVSLFLHVFSFVLAMEFVDRNAKGLERPAEIFSVTLEGGESLYP